MFKVVYCLKKFNSAEQNCLMDFLAQQNNGHSCLRIIQLRRTIGRVVLWGFNSAEEYSLLSSGGSAQHKSGHSCPMGIQLSRTMGTVVFGDSAQQTIGSIVLWEFSSAEQLAQLSYDESALQNNGHSCVMEIQHSRTVGTVVL
jgi:hypothetical protein